MSIYQPAIGPSPTALLVNITLSAGSSAVATGWSHRVVLLAAAEQQWEAEAPS